MSKKKDDHTINELIERMLSHLEERRQGGDGVPPHTLEELATLCEMPLTSPQFVKAAKNKAFTTRAVVASKGKLLPEAPVVLKDHAADEPVVTALLEFARKSAPEGRDGETFAIPNVGDWLATPLHKPFKEGVTRRLAQDESTPWFAGTPRPKGASQGRGPSASELAGRMRSVLESLRRLGGRSYPPTLSELADLCDVKSSSPIVIKAAQDVAFSERAVAVGMKGKSPIREAPVLLREDIKDEAIVPALLKYAMTVAADPKKKTVSHAFTAAELAKPLAADVRGPFEAALGRGIEREALPAEYAWVVIKGKPHLFAVDNMRPASRGQASAIRPTEGAPVGEDGPATISLTSELRDFGAAFREAFESLDRRNGMTNFVKLVELRHVLSDFDRPMFDAGLNRLRDADEFGLNSHEGLHGALTPEEREAGMREAGSLLVYVSRR